MLVAIIITIAVLLILAAAFRSGRRGGEELITHRPYNNPYSDASAARDFRGE
ncbi:MAG TPA: hypothetical protein VLJ42_08325 [Solirubrobacteraceae bacterium]|nr:hypothetical protein [Solirubrobacteraceae bacterium]